MIVEHLRLIEKVGATWGIWKLPSGFECVTIELPWKDNKRNVSCWPLGDHPCALTYSPHFKRRMYLVSVPERSGCRPHPANFVTQLRGCLAPGRKIAKFPNGKWGVTNSRTTFDRIMRELNGRPFTLRTYGEGGR